MFEKVNPNHPDKVADRIAGAIVDYAYSLEADPKIAVEVLIGHELCTIIVETSVSIKTDVVENIVHRIAGRNVNVKYLETRQDAILASNQSSGVRCGDNGIFKGMPVTPEQKKLTEIAKNIYQTFPSDGKYILTCERLIIVNGAQPGIKT